MDQIDDRTCSMLGMPGDCSYRRNDPDLASSWSGSTSSIRLAVKLLGRIANHSNGQTSKAMSIASTDEHGRPFRRTSPTGPPARSTAWLAAVDRGEQQLMADRGHEAPTVRGMKMPASIREAGSDQESNPRTADSRAIDDSAAEAGCR